MTSVLREIRDVRQVPGELRRRWFTSETMDLIVWVDAADEPAQLQLCYDKGRRRAERAFTWKPGTGFTHTAVDDGEYGNGRYKATPIMVVDGGFNTERVVNLFRNHSINLPDDIVDFVAGKICEYQAVPDLAHLPSLSANSSIMHYQNGAL
jgi:hypothetical protein